MFYTDLWEDQKDDEYFKWTNQSQSIAIYL